MSHLGFKVFEGARKPSQGYSLGCPVPLGSGKGGSGVIWGLLSDSLLLVVFLPIPQAPLGTSGLLNTQYTSVKLFIVVCI